VNPILNNISERLSTKLLCSVP